jgi:hypothetical protein
VGINIQRDRWSLRVVKMREILKRGDPRIKHCTIVRTATYSYAQLPTGWMYEVAPLCSCGEEFYVTVHKDDSTTMYCEECDTEVWAPAPQLK